MPKSKRLPQVKRRRRDSFSVALKAAEKRLRIALKECDAAQKVLASLNAEIPNLQGTIRALQQQLHPGDNKVAYSWEQLEVLKLNTGTTIVPEVAALPADDLTGMGSTRDPDDELLPEAEGTPLVPEE